MKKLLVKFLFLFSKRNYEQWIALNEWNTLNSITPDTDVWFYRLVNLYHEIKTWLLTGDSDNHWARMYFEATLAMQDVPPGGIILWNKTVVRASGSTLLLLSRYEWSINHNDEGQMYVHRRRSEKDKWELVYRTGLVSNQLGWAKILKAAHQHMSVVEDHNKRKKSWNGRGLVDNNDSIDPADSTLIV